MATESSGTRPFAGPVVTPPYAAFVAFDAFLRRAAGEAIPPGVDKALLVDWGIAAGNESGLVTSLKSLGIVDEGGRPTDLFHELRLSPPRRSVALRRCLELAYPGLPFAANLEHDENRLHDYFVETRGLTGQMVDKAMRFYRQLAVSAQSTTTDSPPVPRLRSSRARPIKASPAQLTLENVELPPLPVPTRRSRSRAGSLKRAAPPLRLNLQFQVPPAITEDELVELFRRVQAAWIKSLRRPLDS